MPAPVLELHAHLSTLAHHCLIAPALHKAIMRCYTAHDMPEDKPVMPISFSKHVALQSMHNKRTQRKRIKLTIFAIAAHLHVTAPT